MHARVKGIFSPIVFVRISTFGMRTFALCSLCDYGVRERVFKGIGLRDVFSGCIRALKTLQHIRCAARVDELRGIWIQAC